ncbi:MAG: hypothetical protein JKY59_00825 [Emcibacter sp.]|nr:hypothetical protein [Emcibacter sp.]
MTYIDLSTLKVGDEIPPLSLKPISRTTLALFAGASGDHNPIHIDLDVAKSAGMDDVFCQGMLGMAYMSRLLTNMPRLRKSKPLVLNLPILRKFMHSSPVAGKLKKSKTPRTDNY